MRLISLTANQEGFHAVTFNRDGPSLILGMQKERGAKAKSKGQTYNGVGKSLLLYLINYCLGADARENFTEQLAGWEFRLTCELAGKTVEIRRSVSNGEAVHFGTEDISVDELRARLLKSVFPAAEQKKFLTFRSLMGLFLRPGKTAYSIFDGIHFSEKPVQKLMRSAFLLGLDIDLVLEKYNIRQEIKLISEMSARFTKDPILREYFLGKKDVNLDIRELQDQLQELETALAEFKVAENYRDVEQEVAALQSALQKARNAATILEAKIAQVTESLTVNPNVSVGFVRSMYERAKVIFTPTVLKPLEEVEAFHNQLLVTRQTRLKQEKKMLEQRHTAVATQIRDLNSDVDQKLRFLNEHGALGELLSLSERANDVRSKLQRLLDYKELRKKYKDRAAELQVELAAANVRAQKYLDDNQSVLSEAEEMFRRITRRIYPDKKSGLTIENDTGDNQTRFKVDAKILSDASDGINEAKIFAYDLTIASLKRNHLVEFLCHDSRLFSDIDPRQRAEIFRIADEQSAQFNFQYIATVNQDQVEAMRPLMTPDEYERIIGSRVVLQLNDESPADRLLGREIDINYDAWSNPRSRNNAGNQPANDAEPAALVDAESVEDVVNA